MQILDIHVYIYIYMHIRTCIYIYLQMQILEKHIDTLEGEMYNTDMSKISYVYIHIFPHTVANSGEAGRHTSRRS